MGFNLRNIYVKYPLEKGTGRIELVEGDIVANHMDNTYRSKKALSNRHLFSPTTVMTLKTASSSSIFFVAVVF